MVLELSFAFRLGLFLGVVLGLAAGIAIAVLAFAVVSSEIFRR